MHHTSCTTHHHEPRIIMHGTIILTSCIMHHASCTTHHHPYIIIMHIASPSTSHHAIDIKHHTSCTTHHHAPRIIKHGTIILTSCIMQIASQRIMHHRSRKTHHAPHIMHHAPCTTHHAPRIIMHHASSCMAPSSLHHPWHHHPYIILGTSSLPHP